MARYSKRMDEGAFYNSVFVVNIASLPKIFDRANEQERLFGLRLDGVWMHVGTPDAVAAAEEAYLESVV